MTQEITAHTTRQALVILLGRLRAFFPLLLAALPVYGLHHLGGPLLALPVLAAGVATFVWWKRRAGSRLAAPTPRP